MTVREMQCELERTTLSKRACLSENSAGRDYPISPCDLRTAFQRDRDRIIHSKSFRRLMHKTQVFLSPEEDHYRTRLTHTLEVSQIARTIAMALRLNEDLCEAIALGHDLGHTPFGHAGERVLQRCYYPDFTHYRQSLRVVEVLERLNLTKEVRDGIACHTLGGASTLEGRIVRLADRVAYINHDIDDAIRAGILSMDDIPVHLRRVLGDTHGKRIDTMVRSAIRAGETSDEMWLEPDIAEATEELHAFLFERVYRNPIAKGQEGKAEELLAQLYRHFVTHPQELPEEYEAIADAESVGRAVCDYISGMTDRYAINMYKRIFIPDLWQSKAD